MLLRFIRLTKDAKQPTKAHTQDAGFDIYCTSVKKEKRYLDYKTGICVDIPKGYVGLLFPRSSVTNKDMILGNCVGVVDSGYTGELSFRYKSLGEGNDVYSIGDRVGQLVIIELPSVKLKEVRTLSKTKRGSKGYGSSGA